MDLTLPQLRAALEKATEAYGAAISRDLAKAIDRLQHRLGWLDRCMHAGHGHRHAQSRALGKNSKSQAGPLSLFNWLIGVRSQLNSKAWVTRLFSFWRHQDITVILPAASRALCRAFGPLASATAIRR